MKIAYYLHWNDVPDSGVIKKIVHQITQWMNFDLDVKIFILTQNENWNSTSIEIPLETRIYSNNLNRLISSYDLVNQINAWNPDLIYTRYDLYNPVLELFTKIPMVMEINTDDLTEYSMGSFFRQLYNNLTRKHYLKMADGLIFVTEEIAKRPHFETDKKIKIISNGIDLQLYYVLPPPKNQYPNLVFIGTEGQLWHGADKIKALASMFPNWRFHIIGNSSQQGTITKDNIVYYPFLSKDDYQNIMANADVALGTLALHRNNMNQACPLKVREYLAYGLPVIIGYEDMDLKGFNGVMQIANTPNNVYDYKDQIDRFVKEWMGKRINRQHLRIDAREKEIERIEFFTEIVEERKAILSFKY